jgi:hypothetical protein
MLAVFFVLPSTTKKIKQLDGFSFFFIRLLFFEEERKNQEKRSNSIRKQTWFRLSSLKSADMFGL